jgi:lipopolysaccharide export system permease protein
MRKFLPSKATQYIFFEMMPSFMMGIAVFVFILLMAQVLHWTEFVLVHGVSLSIVGRIVSYMSISFLPAILPMSLLFSVIMTYSRLSQDSEIVAFRASGMSMTSIAMPALLLGISVAIISAQTSFHVAPWGNRQFELLISKVGQSKAAAVIREGTFSDGFFDKVVYANEVNSRTGELKDVFIYDEKAGDLPLTIIAKHGQVVQDPQMPNSVMLRLFDGDIHRKGVTHTKIKFDVFDLKITDPVKYVVREKSPPSLTLEEITEILQRPDLPHDNRLTLEAEYHKRWAVSFVCIIFALLGVGLGTSGNRRNQKSGSFLICLMVVVVYWVMYVTVDGMARNGQLPAALAIWLPNLLFGLFTGWILKKNWN